MKNRYKSKTALSLVALSAGVLAIRFQIPSITIISAFTLIFFSYDGLKLALFNLAILLSLLFPAPQLGWLYLRGPHNAAYTTTKILESGWPVEIPLRNSFSKTPFLHMHTAIVSRLTSLPVQPKTTGQVLISSQLPILYTLLIMLFAYLVFRLYMTTNSIDRPEISAFLPVLLWTPLFSLKSSFNRQSVGFLAFIMLFYLVLKHIHSSDKRAVFVLIMILPVIPISHHFAMVMSIFVFIIAIIRIRFGRVGVGDKIRVRETLNWIFLILLLVTLSWWVIAGYGGRYLTITVVATTVGFLESVSTIWTGTAQPEFSDYAVTGSRVGFFRAFLSYWVYQLFLAIGVGAEIYYIYKSKRGSLFTPILVLLFGAVTAILSVFVWAAGVMGAQRPMTYFTAIGGGLAGIGYFRSNDFTKLPLMKILIVILILISVTTIPMYVVSDAEPNYEEGQSSHHFKRSLYATGMFLEEYNQLSIIGDHNAAHVVGGQTGDIIYPKPRVVISGEIPKESVYIHQSYNDKLYSGVTKEGDEFRIGLREDYPNFGISNNVIYDSGETKVYTYAHS